MESCSWSDKWKRSFVHFVHFWNPRQNPKNAYKYSLQICSFSLIMKYIPGSQYIYAIFNPLQIHQYKSCIAYLCQEINKMFVIDKKLTKLAPSGLRIYGKFLSFLLKESLFKTKRCCHNSTFWIKWLLWPRLSWTTVSASICLRWIIRRKYLDKMK